jgi:hypothetical protein
LAEDEARARMRIGKAFGGTSGSTSFAQPTPESQKDLHYAQGLAKAQLGTLPYLNDSAINNIAQESYMGSEPGVLAAKHTPKLQNGAINLGQESELTRQIELFQTTLKSKMPKLEAIDQNVSLSTQINPQQDISEIKSQIQDRLKEFKDVASKGDSLSEDSTTITLSKKILAKVNYKYNYDIKGISTSSIQQDLERALKAARISEKLQNASKGLSPEEIKMKRKVIAKQQYEIDDIGNTLSAQADSLKKLIDTNISNNPIATDISNKIQVNIHNIADISGKTTLTGDKAAEISQSILKSIQTDLKQGLKLDDIVNDEKFRDSIVKQVESAVANVQSTVQNTVANQANTATQNTPTPPTA